MAGTNKPELPKDTLHFPEASRAFLEPHLPPVGKKVGGEEYPFTTLIFATSLDYQLALSPGAPTALSGPQSKAMTHYLRFRHDAILIGVGTAVADDPSLNCRIEGAGGYGGEGLKGQPRPIVVDPTARWNFTEKSKLFTLASQGRGRAPYIITGLQQPPSDKVKILDEYGGKYITLDMHTDSIGEHRLDWRDLLKTLVAENLGSVMIEGGGQVINSLLHPDYSSVVNSVIVTIAPTWLGVGDVVVSPARRFDPDGKPTAVARLDQVQWHPFGEDVVLCGKDQVYEPHFATQTAGSSLLDILDQPDGAIEACRSALAQTQSMLEGLRKTNLWNVVMAAQRRRDIMTLRDRIERLKTILLLALHADHITVSRGLEDYFRHSLLEQHDLRQNVERLLDASQKMSDAREKAYLADRSHKTLCWLSDVDHEANHENARKLQHPGTGLWLVESKPFVEWSQQAHGTFWLRAIPGGGKTILCSHIIQKLQHECSYAAPDPDLTIEVVYFYFDFRDNTKQSVAEMLRSLIHQLSSQKPLVPDIVCSLYDEYKGKKSVPSISKLLSAFKVLVQTCFTKVYCVLDALDECTERASLMTTLIDLIQSKSVSLFVTSRIEHDIVTAFENLPITSALIEEAKVATDVQLFVTQQFQEMKHLRNLSDDLRHEIITALVLGAKGMFRWVVCQMDVFRNLKKPRSIRNALTNLPEGLDETYSRILLSIHSPEEQELLRRTFQMVIFAARPMTLAEVAEAVVIEDECTTLDPELRFTNPEDLISGLRSLLITTGGYLGLSHFSVQEYLLSDRIATGPASFFAMSSARAAEEIGRTCLTYLGYSDFESGPCPSPSTFESRISSYPFLDYASNHWFVHLQQNQVQQSLVNLFDQIFTTSDSSKYKSWFQAFCDTSITRKRNFDTYLLTNPPILYYPSLWGLTVFVTSLLSRSSPINTGGGYYGHPLQAAATHAHCDVLDLLITAGADVNAFGGYYGTALEAAASSGSTVAVNKLLHQGADVGAHGGAYGNALQAAARNGHVEVIKLLITNGASANASGGPFGFALQAAASNGHEAAVEVLIQSGADVNAQGGAFGNALQAAALNGRLAIVNRLVRHGADVNFQGGLYSNALLAASLNGHDSVVKALLVHGADPDVQHGAYANALQAASLNGYDHIVAILLQHGADSNIQGGQYANALQAASRNGHEAVVQLLLSNNANVNQLGGYYGNALQAAARNGFDKVVAILLDAHADANLEGGVYGNALQAASSNNHIKSVQFLLSHGSNVNAIGGSCYTALHAAAYYSHDRVVSLLIESGADHTIEGGKYGTALEAAMANEHNSVVELIGNYSRMQNSQHESLPSRGLFGGTDSGSRPATPRSMGRLRNTGSSKL